MKKTVIIALCTFILGIAAGWLLLPGSSDAHEGHENAGGGEAVEYTCSMHPQIKQNEPGDCPICGMDLTPMSREETSGSQGALKMSAAALKLADVQTAPVGNKAVGAKLKLSGKIALSQPGISTQTAHIAGRVEKLYVRAEGDQVKKGQVIAELYSPELLSAQRELLEAKKAVDRYPGLYAASRKKLAFWKLSDKQIAKIEEQGEPIANFQIRADQSGYVLNKKVELGDYVKEGQVLFRLANLKEVWAELNLHEREMGLVQPGDRVKLNVQALSGKSFDGVISYIDPVIDRKSRVALARVVLDNSSGLLKPEMLLSARVQAGNNEKEVLSVPKTAVMWTGKRSVVYVKQKVDDELYFEMREVVLGSSSGKQYEVLSGLEAGEEIAISGAFSIDAAAQLAGKPSMMSLQPRGEEAYDYMDLQKTEFKVYGNCEMCKERIETGVKSLDGVVHAHWGVDSKMLKVEYTEGSTNADELKRKVAEVGHDTESYRASDEVYDALHGCCQYERPE